MHNGNTMPNPSPGEGSLPSHSEVAGAASMLHTMVAMSPDSDRFPGFTAMLDEEGRACIRRSSPAGYYSELDIFEANGVWYLREERVIPEEGRTALRERHTYPLADGAPTFHERQEGVITGDFADQRLFAGEQDGEVSVGEPVDEQTRLRLLNAIRTVTGEQPIIVPRPNERVQKKGRLGGLGRFLGLGPKAQ